MVAYPFHRHVYDTARLNMEGKFTEQGTRQAVRIARGITQGSGEYMQYYYFTHDLEYDFYFRWDMMDPIHAMRFAEFDYVNPVPESVE